jgi:hypothetical protein
MAKNLLIRIRERVAIWGKEDGKGGIAVQERRDCGGRCGTPV